MEHVDALSLRILSILGKKPKASLRNLSKEVGLSPISLRKKIEEMFNNGLLYGVSARINPHSLGLSLTPVFVDVPADKVVAFERVCDIHPYTHYRVRCFGSINGIFAIFQIPSDTTYLLVELLEELSKEGIVRKWLLESPLCFPVGSEADYSFYEPNVGWKFDWDAWAKSINSESSFEPKGERNVLSLLDSVDMKILRELSTNILRKRSEIARAVGIKLYHLNKRWKRLERLRVIEGYRVLAGLHVLQISSYIILRCKCSIKTAMKVASAIVKLPFQSTFYPTQYGFVLFIMTTSSDYPHLIAHLRDYCEEMSVFWCDYQSSIRYRFYDEAFSEGSWRSDRDFMVNKVLNGLKASN
ncbi:MAG: winged helix-turn-helix transcriptional regulator [Candidatus Nezhaarchaeales archaeon]